MTFNAFPSAAQATAIAAHGQLPAPSWAPPADLTWGGAVNISSLQLPGAARILQLDNMPPGQWAVALQVQLSPDLERQNAYAKVCYNIDFTVKFGTHRGMFTQTAGAMPAVVVPVFGTAASVDVIWREPSTDCTIVASIVPAAAAAFLPSLVPIPGQLKVDPALTYSEKVLPALFRRTLRASAFPGNTADVQLHLLPGAFSQTPLVAAPSPRSTYATLAPGESLIIDNWQGCVALTGVAGPGDIVEFQSF